MDGAVAEGCAVACSLFCVILAHNIVRALNKRQEKRRRKRWFCNPRKRKHDHPDEVIEEPVVIDAANDESRPSTPEPLTPSPKPVEKRKFISPIKLRPEIASAKKKKPCK